MLGALGQVQNGLQADDLRACCLNGGILPGQQPQIVQLFGGKDMLILHIDQPFLFVMCIITDFPQHNKGRIVKKAGNCFCDTEL